MELNFSGTIKGTFSRLKLILVDAGYSGKATSELK